MPASNGFMNKLQGVKDSRGPVGIFSRGKNVYNAASSAAQSGGGSQYGRPGSNANGAVQRRIAKRNKNAFIG